MEPISNLAIVIMAAGKGTRLKSRRPKVLHEIGGKPLLAHVIAAAAQIVAPENIYAIVGHQADKVKAAVAATGIRFVEQADQRGTGHAVQCAKDAIAGYENILVLSGDAPLIQAETLAALAAFHQAQKAAMTLTTAEPSQPTGYGRIIHPAPGSPEVSAIIEQKMLTPEQLGMREVNMGLYAFRTAPLLAHLGKLTTDNPHGELYLTDMAQVLAAAGQRVVAFHTDDPDQLLGANTIAEMMALDASLRLATARRLMDSGVTIFRPETCVIDSAVTIGPDTIIEPYVQLLGNTHIGSDSHIRSYSVIQNSRLGDNVLVRNGCILDTAEVANNAILGPYAHLRPESRIGDGAHVGNFVETKKTIIGRGSKANHLSYLGDAVIGDGVNIGAGAITCNYDGVHKHPTIIGNGAFIGSDSTLVAPVTIGAGSYIAAGSSITEDVPEGALALGRSRQTTKPGWVAARKAAKKDC